MKRLMRLISHSGPYARRCIAMGLALALVAIACLGKLVAMQLVEGRATAQAATNARTSKVVLSASRGRILDANGTVLAQSVERYNIIGDPLSISTFKPVDCGSQEAKTLGYCHAVDGKPVGAAGAAAVARLLAPVLGLDRLELGAKLDGTSRYVVIKRDVTPETKRRIDDLHLAGVVYGELSSERVYADGTLMGSLLGGVDDAGVGVAGLEKVEDRTLTGTDGYMIYQRGNGGEVIPGTVTAQKDAVDGKDVTLTLDADVDWYVKKVLTDGVAKFGAKWAIAVVQDAATGEILALEDSDQIEAGSDQAKMTASRAVTQSFEPGSVGKVITMAGLLQTGARQASDQFTVPDRIDWHGQEFQDSSPHGAERWTLTGIVAHSSNVGMVMASENYTNDQRYEFLRKFGFGQPSALGLPGESQGVLCSPEQWDGRTKDTVLFGQGYSVNALQLTNAVATIANKGVRHDQSIVKSVTGANGKEESVLNTGATRVVDEAVAAQVLDAMEDVAESYKSTSSVPGYRIAAKSGTAQVAGPDGRLTSIVADYSAIIPADNPRFVITVAMQDPAGTYGGITSGSLVAQIGEFLMQKYQVPNSAPRKDAAPMTW
ncbi:penicillin-binding protein 2 [Bifidobacterium pullorum subsp. saeculare]|uniref:Penicillin-binding protein 2 n=1 Tax=Bifidobacterium pullorum subsp. saeculare TaxID=78257 RepID=A0A938WXP4_9BIFI|nr:penicillin-binding protein 2 [Bifidobacterium pullorum]MBM6698933.1 penicillin-binding protein 2 [Bifidobacterium pullorum subsp. saeculare]